jgi:muconolactone delta-isomerase
MVSSTPRPEQPSKVRGQQRKWWRWIAPLQNSGVVKALWIKTGRGAVVVFNVDSNEHLHQLINQWQECVPANFAVQPLIEPSHQANLAQRGGSPLAAKSQNRPGRR